MSCLNMALSASCTLNLSAKLNVLLKTVLLPGLRLVAMSQAAGVDISAFRKHCSDMKINRFSLELIDMRNDLQPLFSFAECMAPNPNF